MENKSLSSIFFLDKTNCFKLGLNQQISKTLNQREKMKTYTPEELKEILKLHKMWILGKEKGIRANLSRANLSRANLSRADLYRADLSGANLYRADLSEANLYRADLSEANLYGAGLYRADLSRAKLKEKIISKSKKTATYIGADYYCVFIGSIIKIGCEVHYRSSWEKFTKKDIEKMDGEIALKFWRKEKQTVLKISRTLSR